MCVTRSLSIPPLWVHFMLRKLKSPNRPVITSLPSIVMRKVFQNVMVYVKLRGHYRIFVRAVSEVDEVSSKAAACPGGRQVVNALHFACPPPR